MPASKKPETQERTAQLGIKVNAQLYSKYKKKLEEDGISITEDIERHMRSCVGEVIVQSNVIDITAVLRDVEELKQAMGELNPDWQQRMTVSSVS
jgi:PAS domain-containing protein